MTTSKLEVLQQNLICQAVRSFTTNILFRPVVTTLHMQFLITSRFYHWYWVTQFGFGW